MTEFWLLIAGAVLGVIGNEFLEVSPWLARRLIPRAARLWTDDPERREILTEEWLAIIDERPGKLFKLMSATAFLVSGLRRRSGARACDVAPARWLRGLAGVDESVLDMVPRERPRYTALGAEVLVVGVSGALTMAFVLHWSVAGGWPLAVPLALGWAFLIVLADRQMVTAGHGARRGGRLPRFGLRLLVAVGLGLVMAEPLTVQMFDRAVTRAAETHRDAEITAQESRLRACNGAVAVDGCAGWVLPPEDRADPQRAIALQVAVERFGGVDWLDKRAALGRMAASDPAVAASVWTIRALLVLLNCLPVLTMMLGGTSAYDRAMRLRRTT